MKSIQRRFERIANKNIFLSTYICFTLAISRQKFSKQTISKWFNKLVHQDEYDKNDKKSLIAHAVQLTNEPEDTKKQ